MSDERYGGLEICLRLALSPPDWLSFYHTIKNLRIVGRFRSMKGGELYG